MSRKEKGYCHICGTFGELSFEHIPPENALNKGQVKLYTGEEALKKYKGQKSKYINQQQGMGKYSLCEKCNSKMGSWYAHTYNDLVKDIAHSLQTRENLNHGEIMVFTLNDFPALAFVKQVIAMFCSLMSVEEVKRLGFDTFLLEKESNRIDKKLFDLRMYLTSINVGQLMVGPIDVISETKDGVEIASAYDLSVYPFGFILNTTPNCPIEYGTSIMKMFDVVYEKNFKLDLPLMYLERTSEIVPLPLIFKSLP